MITMVPFDSDWNRIAALTNDDSWRAEKMPPGGVSLPSRYGCCLLRAASSSARMNTSLKVSFGRAIGSLTVSAFGRGVARSSFTA